jgi:hypothetical protein
MKLSQKRQKHKGHCSYVDLSSMFLRVSNLVLKIIEITDTYHVNAYTCFQKKLKLGNSNFQMW